MGKKKLQHKIFISKRGGYIRLSIVEFKNEKWDEIFFADGENLEDYLVNLKEKWLIYKNENPKLRLNYEKIQNANRFSKSEEEKGNEPRTHDGCEPAKAHTINETRLILSKKIETLKREQQTATTA